MKVKIKGEGKKEAQYLSVEAGGCYWEDPIIVNGVEDKDGELLPGLGGGWWRAKINIETGQISDWEKGKEASVRYRAGDYSKYALLDEHYNHLLDYIGDHVPRFLSIGVGKDYITLQIDKDGFIKLWSFNKKDAKCFGTLKKARLPRKLKKRFNKINSLEDFHEKNVDLYMSMTHNHRKDKHRGRYQGLMIRLHKKEVKSLEPILSSGDFKVVNPRLNYEVIKRD